MTSKFLVEVNVFGKGENIVKVKLSTDTKRMYLNIGEEVIALSKDDAEALSSIVARFVKEMV